MGVESKPFYWLTCDEPGCDARSPGDGAEVVAWVDEATALMVASDEDWRILDNGTTVCETHAGRYCDDCGARIDVEYPGEQDYLCTPCWEGFSLVPGDLLRDGTKVYACRECGATRNAGEAHLTDCSRRPAAVGRGGL